MHLHDSSYDSARTPPRNSIPAPPIGYRRQALCGLRACGFAYGDLGVAANLRVAVLNVCRVRASRETFCTASPTGQGPRAESIPDRPPGGAIRRLEGRVCRV